MVAINDRCKINLDGRRPMIRSIDRCILRPLVRAIVAYSDRSYEHSWHPVTERTINRGTRIPMVRSIVGATIDRTTNRCIVRPIVRSLVATYDRSYDHTWHQTIWNRRLEVFNMTIGLAATDFALAITHDLCEQSYVLSTICLRFQDFSVAGRS